MKNVTLADIAAKTGYSINTISHALHDKPDISKKTKEYIIKVASGEVLTCNEKNFYREIAIFKDGVTL